MSYKELLAAWPNARALMLLDIAAKGAAAKTSAATETSGAPPAPAEAGASRGAQRTAPKETSRHG
jgi:hypothetical protein